MMLEFENTLINKTLKSNKERVKFILLTASKILSILNIKLK